jgi:hypothetical protein
LTAVKLVRESGLMLTMVNLLAGDTYKCKVERGYNNDPQATPPARLAGAHCREADPTGFITQPAFRST